MDSSHEKGLERSGMGFGMRVMGGRIQGALELILTSTHGALMRGRKRKKELEKGQEEPEALPVRKKKKKELECTVKVSSEGVAGGVASSSGDPLERDVGLTAVREKELDPPIPQQEENSQALKRKRGRKREENKQERGLKRKRGKKHEENKQEKKLKRKRRRKDKLEDLMDGIEEEEGDEGRNLERGQGKAKKRRRSSRQGWDDGEKKQKGKAKKHRKRRKVEKMGKRKIKEEKLLEEEQEIEKDEEREKGVGGEEEEKKGSGDGKGIKEEEEVDEKGEEGLGETGSAGVGQEGEKDWQKYEVARRLKDVVHTIRAQYRRDWKSKELKKRQRAVALYFIDKLALRAGNEKEEGETADTVGCCSLRVEHIQLHPQLDGQEHVVEFDFLGKDSIRYYNKVSVEKPVFKNLQLFMKNKDPTDDLFDQLTTTFLNKHLQHLMDGLTAKVFRTYNASITLQEQLKALTNPEDDIAGKLLSYNRANRAVAILCNHQRSIPKTFARSMQVLQEKIDAKMKQVEEAQEEVKKAEDEFKDTKDAKAEANVEKKKKLLKRLEEQLAKLNIQATDREENKQIALGTSKLNYLDPRISVAWCKKFGIPIERIYNKTQREKFAWAIDMAGEDFEF
ncbi:hypothetical protein TURU_086268 [Turdus rufiventris]|nr:hypothetical protein TURU_086268 [Turdus rufiventris]